MPLERSNDELADLSSTLNQTAVQLDQTIHTLTDERNRSAAILASMEEGVVAVDTRSAGGFLQQGILPGSRRSREAMGRPTGSGVDPALGSAFDDPAGPARE